MSVHPSSLTFGDEMGRGWKEGLKHKFGDKVNVKLNQKVKDTSGNDLGDVDFICRSNCELDVYTDLFPTAHLNIRPSQGTPSAARKGNCFLAEIKRSMDSHCDEKIKTFVRFYAGLFSDDFRFLKSNGTIARSSASLFGRDLMEAVKNADTRIIFLFNGKDLATVQTKIRNEIHEYLGNTNMMIHNHQVICVWCNSADLIFWEQSLKYESQKSALKTQKAENKSLRTKINFLIGENKSLRTQMNFLSGELKTVMKELKRLKGNEEVVSSKKRKR